jgi:hypothetical protein
MRLDTLPVASAADDEELAPPCSPVSVVAAPELLEGDYVVIRSDDDTDEDYAARCRLLDALLAVARRG